MSTTLKKELKQLVETTGQKLTAVRVVDIILDISHPKAIEFGGYDAIGTIFYSILENNTPLEEVSSANIARPIFSNLKHYPLKNEIVLILSSKDKEIYNSPNSATAYYFPTLNIWNHPHHNALPTIKGLSETSTEQDYEKTEAGIIRKVTDEGTGVNLGKYFQESLNIKPLLPYEGDYIIEGRFGNSIRLGSTNIGEDIPDENNNNWSSTGNIGDPITIIRNGQSSELDNKGWIPTIENINDDLTSLYLTSNQQLSNFRVASTNFQSYQAKLELPQTVLQALTDPQLNVIVESEQPETSNLSETTADSFPVDESPVLVSPEVVDEEQIEQGDQSPFDLFMQDPENFSIQEIEPVTENQEIDSDDPVIKNQNDVETDATGPIDNTEKIGRYYKLDQLLQSPTARSGITYVGWIGKKFYGKHYIVLINGKSVRGTTEMIEPFDWFKKHSSSYPLDPKKYYYWDTEKGNYELSDEYHQAVAAGATPTLGCSNLPGIDPEYSKETIIQRLTDLMVNVADKIKDKYPEMKVNSVYRQNELNKAIGGDPTSQHRKGMAIDLKVKGVLTSDIFNWIIGYEPPNEGIPLWDQVIWEFPHYGSTSWIHISYGGAQRKRKTVAIGSDAKGLKMRKAIPTDRLYTHSDVNPNFKFADQNIVPA